jgi:hypothetical protein
MKRSFRNVFSNSVNQIMHLTQFNLLLSQPILKTIIENFKM